MRARLAIGLRPNQWDDATIGMLEVADYDELVPHLKCRNSKRKVAGLAFKDIQKARKITRILRSKPYWTFIAISYLTHSTPENPLHLSH